MTLEAEVVVIGSGFGGAVTACRLAQAGYQVTILERGRRYVTGDAPNLPQNGSFLPDERRWSWALDQGLWEVIDLDEIVSVQAAAYGGGSHVYANVHLRPPRSIFNSAWPKVYRDRGELDKYYDLVASMLEVAPVKAHPNFHEEITKSQQLQSAVENLGRRVFYPPLAIRYEDGPNAHGVPQRKCTGCGACCTGCPQGAKNTLDLNYLAIAERYGARVFTQFEVLQLVERRNGSWLIRCFDHLEAQRVSVKTSQVFLCAGSIHSTELMARARLLKNRQLPQGDPRLNRTVKRRVGLGYFPGGDALGIVYETKHPQRPAVGPVISTAVVEWSRTEPNSFFMLQDGGYPDRGSRLVGLLRASALLNGNRITRKGKASVAALTRRGQSNFGQPSEPFATSRAPSTLDLVLDAHAGGTFTPAVPAQLKGLTERLAKRLSLPLLMSKVVGEAIVRSLRHRFRCLGVLGKPLVFLGTVAARLTMGPNRFVGVRGLHALLQGGPLQRDEFAARVAGISDKDGEHRAVLLGMGRDAAVGHLKYDVEQRRMVADLNLAKLAPGYSKQESLMTDVAHQLGGELRNNPAWEFLHKPVTVHNQGGCRMADRDHPERPGVTDENGKVYGCNGLYILDGSLLCTSVGVNPSSTIAAIAERGVLEFIRTNQPLNPNPAGLEEYEKQVRRAELWAEKAAGWDLEPLDQSDAPPGHINPPVGIKFNEKMAGYYRLTQHAPRDPADYLEHETAGRPHFPIELEFDQTVGDLKAFIEDPSHRLTFKGKITLRLPGEPLGQARSHDVDYGTLDLFVPVSKDYAFHRNDERSKLQHEIAREAWGNGPLQHWNNLCQEPLMQQLVQHLGKEVMKPDGSQRSSVRPNDPLLRERLMIYRLEFKDANRVWSLVGYKRIASTSGLEAWRQTATLFCLLAESPLADSAPLIRGAGAVHLDLLGFRDDVLGNLVATGTDDPNRKVLAVMEFGRFFFGTLQRIYLPTLQKVTERAGAQRRLKQLD